MSIATRPLERNLASGSRDGREPWIGISRPPEVLLPDGGTLAPAPAPAPQRVLARDALRLIRRSQIPGHDLGAWRHRDVDAVRRQLDPIHSRRSLAASYRRESFNQRDDPNDVDRPEAARLAYALRWLELGPDRP